MSSSRAFKSRRATMAGLIQSGRRSHATGTSEQRRGLALVTKAMRSCPCNKGVGRPRCACKDYEGTANEGRSILDEAMHTCYCGIGKKFENCYNMQHIKALCVRSSMYKAMGKLDLAEEDAEWILELAPRLPHGYLCLGHIVWQNGHDKYAWNLYSAGLEAIKDAPVGFSPKLKQQLLNVRKPLFWRFFKQDPLLLPPEIVTHIFSYLDFVQLLVCLRVCKKWNSTLTRPPHCQLWRNMVVGRFARRELRVDDMQRMLTWAGKGGVRKIKIATDVRFSNAALTVLMKASPSLEHLEILTLDGLNFPSKEKIWNQLRHISIITHQRLRYNDADRPGCFPQTFIQNAASSLEHLDFVGIPQEWYGMRPAIPNLPNLKTLRIGDHDDYDPDSDDNMDDYFDLGMIRTPFPIVPLARAFPKLEQLCIGPDVPCLAPSIGRTGQNKWEDIWPNLKVFAFHLRSQSDLFTESSRSTLRYLTRLNSLQHISLGVESSDWPCMFSGSYHPLPDLDVNQRSEFQNLRSFSSETLCISPDGARTLLSNAIKSNQLTSFDFVFPYDTDRHLKGYDWLRGSPSIQTLGCYKYRFPFDLANADDLLLPQFLATFPNLRTLRIKLCSTAEPPQLAKLLLAIFSVTHLKTVYTSVYEDKFVVRLRKVAQGYGVKLINNEPDYDGQWHRYEAWSHPWPIPSSALGA